MKDVKQVRTFIILSILIVIGRTFDVTTTYLYTPDLKNETNIIVKLFGAGWISIIMLQLILIALTIFCLYYYFFRFRPAYPVDRNLGLKQFSSYLFFGNTSSFKKLFYKIPKYKTSLIASTGYIASMTLISVSFLVGTSTSMLLLSDTYKTLYKNGAQTLLFVFIGMAAIWFTIRFLKIEYKKYQRRTHSALNELVY